MGEPRDSIAIGGTRLFLDAEWADDSGHELVSLALVDDSGEHRFYAEIDPLPSKPTDFARFVVYPLLERGWSAMQKADLSRSLQRFMDGLEKPVVLYDHPADWALLSSALGRFVDPGSADHCAVANVLLHRNEMAPLIEIYFHDHPASASFRHHARIDAEALRWAYFARRILD